MTNNNAKQLFSSKNPNFLEAFIKENFLLSMRHGATFHKQDSDT